MAKIIILNAPPGAGKDTICDLIKDESPVPLLKMSFKQPMFEIALAILGAQRYADFLDLYNCRETKEKPVTWLIGKSPREFMIWISEEVIKPNFGMYYFGHRLSQSASNAPCDVICSDGGFAEEIQALLIGGHTVELCRLHREGFTFAGDSRSYLMLGNGFHPNYREHDFHLIDGRPMETVHDIIHKFLL